MKTVLFLYLLPAAFAAVTPRDSTCCFHLTADGGPGGAVGSLSDGQARIGQNLPAIQYCIGGNGGLTDSSGRGCILTPPTTQFQCDAGASPSTGFTVGCDGALLLNNHNDFYACPTGDNGGYNIYSSAPSGQQGCVTVTLKADGCKSNCPAPSSAPDSTFATTPTPSASAPPKSSSCPADLSGTWEFPHLIVPVDSSTPNTAGQTSYNGTLSPSISSIFNFDVPYTYATKTCTFIFLLPKQSALVTSAYALSGSGAVDFALLSAPAVAGSTSYGNLPSVQQDLGQVTLSPGMAGVALGTLPCPAGERVGVLAKSVGDTCLDYFQDWNEPAIGLYVSVC